MAVDDFEDEEVILIDEAVVLQLAFQIGVAFGDKRRADLRSWFYTGGAEFLEFVDRSAGAIADADNFVKPTPWSAH